MALLPVMIKPGKVLTLRRFLAIKQIEANQEERDALQLQTFPQKITEKIKALVPFGANPNTFATVKISPGELFKIIASSGLSATGQVSTGYQAKGIGTDVTITFGKKLSIASQEIGAEISATVGGQINEYAFHLIQILPRNFISNSAINYPIERNIYLGKFIGYEKVFNASIDGKAGIEFGLKSFQVSSEQSAKLDSINNTFGVTNKINELNFNISELKKDDSTIEDNKEVPVVIDSVSASDAPESGTDGETLMDEFSLNIELSLSTSAQYAYSYVYLSDQDPSYYESPNDEDLIYEFDANLGIASRRTYIKEILAYLKQAFKQELNGPTKVQAVEDIINEMSTSRAIIAINYSTNNILIGLRKLEDYEIGIIAGTSPSERLNVIQNSIFRIGLIVSEQFTKGKKIDIAKVTQKLNNLEFSEEVLSVGVLGSYSSNDPNVIVYSKDNQRKPAMHGFILTGQNPKLKIETLPNHTEIKKIILLPKPLFISRTPRTLSKTELIKDINAQSYISYSSHKPGLGATVAAKVLGLGAQAGATGAVKLSKYRFQTTCELDANNTLYLTQDTNVTYKQIKCELKILIKGTKESVFANYISYNSVITNWIPQLGRESAESSNGSGIAFGYTISVKTITKWAKIKDSDSIKLSLSKSLNVSIPELNEFFRQLLEKVKVEIPSVAGATSASAPQYRYPFGAPYIIIEASFFAHKQAVFYQTEYLEDSNYFYLIPNHKQRLLDLFNVQQKNVIPYSPSTPESYFGKRFLRARLRVADTDEAVGTCFQCSTGKLSVVDLEFKIAEISKVGAEGVVDLFTYDLLTSMEHDEANNPSGAPFVPPVALFFQ